MVVCPPSSSVAGVSILIPGTFIALSLPGVKGCLHHKLRRHHVALHYFQKALEALSRGEAVRENGTLPQGRMGTGPAGAKGTKGAKGAKGAAGKGGGVESNAAAGAGMGADGHLSPTPTCEILYNTGLQLLLTDKPQEVRLFCIWASFSSGSTRYEFEITQGGS